MSDPTESIRRGHSLRPGVIDEEMTERMNDHTDANVAGRENRCQSQTETVRRLDWEHPEDDKRKRPCRHQQPGQHDRDWTAGWTPGLIPSPENAVPNDAGDQHPRERPFLHAGISIVEKEQPPTGQ